MDYREVEIMRRMAAHDIQTVIGIKLKRGY